MPIADASDASLQGWSARVEDLVDKDDHDGAPYNFLRRLAAVGIEDRTGADDGTSERAADLPPGVTDHGRANRDGELTTAGEHYNEERSFDVYLLLTPFNC
ncbi:unnamed protein product [Sphagnum tenellum]